MATPDFLSLCCVANLSKAEIDSHEDLELINHVMNIISMTFSVVSLVGMVYLVLPRESSNTDWWRSPGRILAGPNLNVIIKCIVLSNFLATTGLFLRSLLWVAGQFPSLNALSVNSKHVFCMVSTIWIEYFFLCNFFWHLMYSIEAFMVSNNNELNSLLKYTLGWFAPGVLCVVTVMMIYSYGVHGCIDVGRLNKDLAFIFFLSPVVIVLVFSPIFFYKAAKLAKKALIWHYGRYTSNERKLVDAIHLKFVLIVVSFSACWLPNIINAILRMSAKTFAHDALYATWIIMGVVNPLQGLFGTLVLWGIPRHPIAWQDLFLWNRLTGSSSYESNINNSSRTQSISQRSTGSGSESEPLISFRRKNPPYT